MQLLKILKELETKKSFPNLKCPFCESGHLCANEDNGISYTIAQTQEHYDLLDDPTVLVDEYAYELNCNNNACKEKAIVVGKTNTIEDGYDDGYDFETGEQLHPGFPTYCSKYKIDYLSVPVKLIDVPTSIDKSLKDCIESSFKLFWTDLNSCGNRLRTIVEILLNKIEVEEHSNLSQRIKYLATDNNNKFQNLAKKFTSIKHFGNLATHEYKEISKEDTVNSFKVIEYCLNEIYKISNEPEVDRISQELTDKYKKK